MLRGLGDRFVLMTAISLAVVMGISGALGLGYLFFRERDDVGQHLRMQSEVLANQLTQSIKSANADEARNILESFRSVRWVEWAAVVVDGQVFAAYGRVPVLSSGGSAESPVVATVSPQGLLIRHPIDARSGERSELLVSATLEPSDGRIVKLAFVGASLALLVVLMLLPTILFLVRRITRPLSQLARLANRVTQSGDSGQRAVVGDDEIGELAFAFNKMLDSQARITSDLIQSRETLRALNIRLNQVRESERMRIAREIHDELGQMLTRLKFDVAWIRQNAENSGQVTARATEMTGFLDQAMQTVRRISWELRPGVLDTLGLTAALESLSAEFQRNTGIRSIVDLDELPEDINTDLASNLFRIAQELLTNVGRHAQATAVEIVLEVGDDISLTVTDNGIGLSSDFGGKNSLGLQGIRERVRQFDGQVFIDSQPNGRGTRVWVKVPCILGTLPDGAEGDVT